MKAVIQRVKKVVLSVDNKVVSKIDNGLLVFLGISTTDTEKQANRLVDKISKLRIFEDSAGKMNLNLEQTDGKVLLVSNFTLYADASSNRPSFSGAGKPEMALPLYEYTCRQMSIFVPTEKGIFGADMQIETVLDGPVTIQLEY